MTSLWVLLPVLLGAAYAERHFLFTAPKASDAGESEKMCLTLFDVPETGWLILELRYDGRRRTLHMQQVSGVAGGSKQTCFDVQMPEREIYSATLKLYVTFPSETNYSISSERRIAIRGSSTGGRKGYLFVQTDKYVYKPGQLVQLRVFSVDSDLRPVTKPFPLIYIETPLGTRVSQWIDEKSQNGLVQLEFQLSEEPTLGNWAINVLQTTDTAKSSVGAVHKKIFQVKEYVLPKFEVDVKGPPFILADTNEATLKVCGTYTYGKPVAGNASVHIEAGFPYHYRRWWNNRRDKFPSLPDRYKLTDADGCAEFRVSAEDLLLNLNRPRLRIDSYVVRATLTEEGTDAIFETVKEFRVERTKLKLTLGNNDRYFKPGLPYVDQLMVTHPDDSPAPGEKVKICMKGGSNYAEQACKNLISDERGVVKFYVPPQNRNIKEVNIEATLPEQMRTAPGYMSVGSIYDTMKAWSSKSGAFLQLSKMAGVKFSCGAAANIPVLFTVPLGSKLELFYQVMSQGDLSPAVSVPVTFDEVADLAAAGLDGATAVGSPSSETSPIGLVTLSIPVKASMSTGFKVVVYTIVEGEVVADSAKYEATPCLENSVSLKWLLNRVQPKQPTQMTISAAPGSLCGLDVVDKSVHLLGTKNRISLSEFFGRLKKRNLQLYDGHSQVNDGAYCRAKHGDPSPYHPTRTKVERRERRFFRPWHPQEYHWITTQVDSLAAFDGASYAVMADYITESRTCEKRSRYVHFGPVSTDDEMLYAGPPERRRITTTMRRRRPVVKLAPRLASSAPTAERQDTAEAPSQGADEPSPVPDTVRTYFPETWLFDLHTVSEDGTVTLSQEAPDTITEWVAGAVCTSETAGLGISEPASLTSFQPFFVSYTLPYSVKRGETLILKVSVRNYNQHDLPVKLTLVASDEFDTLTPSVDTSCIPADASVVMPFKLRPSALGDVNITTVAEVYPDYPSVCGPETVLHFSDAVTRPVLVEPEGFEREIINSSFVCGTTENNDLGAGTDLDVTWPLTLPGNLVPGSERARVEVVGDLLGPSIDNLESLVRQPTGCGEQNMVLFVPNIHVMKYLLAVGELTEPIKVKLDKYMKKGYQRELTYRHKDKSYSAFGASDSSGSMWLTAFVVKSFGDAKEFIFIDEDDLVGSVRWIESEQMADGCFPSVGRVLQKEMKGGVSSGGQQALTAFVTIALLRSSVTLGDNTLRDAFRCLYQDTDTDLYTLTLRTYARALAGHMAEARTGLAKLKNRATRREGLLFWQNSDSEENKALSVEMGAYIILTMDLLREAGDLHHFSDALAAVRWINEQRNSCGGFVSTQDTVLALEALAAFSASLPRSSTSNLRLSITDRHYLNEVISVTPANRLLMQLREVTRLPGVVQVRATGTGCALVQTVLRYNVQESDPSDALSISIKSKPKPSQSHCLKHIVETCVSYDKPGESNMAVVEIEMVSGFIPNKGSLEALKSNRELDLKRWEVSKNKVVFYFDSLDGRRRCLEMVVQRDQEVEDVKPAKATVYDYYQAEVALSTSYTHDLECATMSA